MENINDFNKLEKTVLEWIAIKYNDANLSEQIKHAKFVKKDWTKHGFFVYFTVPKNLVPLDKAIFRHFPIDGPIIESRDIDYDGDAILWGKDGYIDCIEMFAFGSIFNEEVRDFKLYDTESFNEIQRQKGENKI